MNLKEFVSETLLSIINGVIDAQEKANEVGALVNPGGLTRNTKNINNNSLWDNTTNNYAQNVDFDIAVTTEDSAQGGAKIKVLTGILGGDMGGEKLNKNAIASRVQFCVPVLLPPQNTSESKARIQSTTEALSKRNT